MYRTEACERSPQARLRREHERAIFRSIAADTAVSRTQLAEQIGLSSQSVGRVVRDLLDYGLVEETDMERSAGPGAPPVGLRVRPCGAYALGFGLERDFLTAVALDLGGGIVWQDSIVLSKGEKAAVTLGRITNGVLELLETPEWKERRSRLCGMGLGAPGPIELTTGAIVGAPNFPSWEHVDVVDELERALDMPVVIDNGATAAAIGVAWRMPRNHASFLFCYWGLGIGGGLVLGDDVYRGTTGNSVEIGHIVVDPNGRACDCGGVGCLEAEASAAALMRDASRYGPFGTVQEIAAAADTMPSIAKLIARAAEFVAAALLSVVNIVDVDEVVLGGEHFHAVERFFLPVIRERIGSRAFRRAVAPNRVSVTGLGEVANAIGAAALVFHSLLPGAVRRRPVEPHPVDPPVPPRTVAARSARLS